MTTTTADHHAPNDMSSIDFSGITPPKEQIGEWNTLTTCGGSHDWLNAYVAAYRAGAQYAAEQLAGRWPEPITDRPPMREDGDCGGFVCGFENGLWEVRHWQIAAHRRTPWRHTPRWNSPAQPLHPADTLAAIVREVDPNRIMGAAQLAEALLAHPDIRRTLEVKS